MLLFLAKNRKSWKDILWSKKGHSDINDLQRKTGKSHKKIKDFLNQQDTYTLHKPARKNFKTKSIWAMAIKFSWNGSICQRK